MVIALISGGLNLAIIATANQCALLMAYTLKALAPAGASGSMIALAIIAALIAGLLLALVIGLVTGFLVANMGVHPILVTLGTMSVINGISICLTRGTVIAGMPEPFLVIGNGVLLGIPIPFLILIATACLVAFILNRTPFGIAVFMIGSNLEATRYAAIDTKRVLIGVYTMSSLLCFLAGLHDARRASTRRARAMPKATCWSPSSRRCSAASIRSAASGGSPGCMLALAVLQVISSSFNLLGLSQHLTLAIWGLTLIAVMGFKAAAAPTRPPAFRQTDNRKGRAMIRFGMHSSLWTASWTREAAELLIPEAARYGLDVIEMALLAPETIDVDHSVALFKAHGVAPTASLCLPMEDNAALHPERAERFLHARAGDRPRARLQHPRRRHLFDARLALGPAARRRPNSPTSPRR